MSHRKNRKIEAPGRWLLPWVLAAMLLLAGIVVFTASPPSSLIASAQRAGQKQKTRSASQRSKTAPAKPTPTRSVFDSLGEPPPPPPTPTPSPKPELEINPGDIISVDTTEVMLPVSVRDANDRFAGELTRQDFRVFEDGREQPLSDLALRQVPVDVVLMVDASSSVASNLDDFRRAAEGFASRLASDDRISLIKFDDRIQLLQDWTQSRFQLRRALTRIEPGMFTRFNDALLLAARQQFSSSKSRRAVIVLSDGIDSGRGTSLESAFKALLEAQVVVYVVGNTEIARATKLAEIDSLLNGSDSTVRFNQLRIDDLREGLRVLDLSEQRLAQLTLATGGRLYKPQSFQALEATYAAVAEELRHQYALYFTPLNKTRDGGFRRVRVETTNPTYQTQTRVGYFAPKS
ncbi:MAG: VWA domain-containing protein [Acidobacteriota bacterium]|nr:VWA domain-containing protein [Acidobacteriota bacterium]